MSFPDPPLPHPPPPPPVQAPGVYLFPARRDSPDHVVGYQATANTPVPSSWFGPVVLPALGAYAATLIVGRLHFLSPDDRTSLPFATAHLWRLVDAALGASGWSYLGKFPVLE